MTRTFRTSLALGFALAFSASLPKAAEAQFCYKCDTIYFPFTCTVGNPAFDPITGSSCQAIPGLWCWVSGSCFGGLANNTFVKESVNAVVAGFFPGTTPRYLNTCSPPAGSTLPGFEPNRRADVVALLRTVLQDWLA